AGTLKLTLAQYRSMAAFAMFASDLDAATRRQLTRGERLMELLKQPQYAPYPLSHQVMLLYAGTRGYLDQVDKDRVNEWSRAFLRYMDTSHANIGQNIMETKRLNNEDALRQAIVDFNASWS
ncbi:MAG: F0F1 ATP synthase subunit alpha, partial [Anaerolineales bacterium]|nr:F0F1 ATP synthase subunit alpha [Anaerolineales bacterium]